MPAAVTVAAAAVAGSGGGSGGVSDGGDGGGSSNGGGLRPKVRVEIGGSRHTKSVNILFYVSSTLQTHIGRQSPIVDLQGDTSSDSSSEDDQDDTGEGGGKQIDTTSHSPPRDGKNDGTEEEAVEDDAASSSSSDGVSNNCISQHFLQQYEGHYCFICQDQEQHHLTLTDLATFETEAQCKHVYCYVSLLKRQERASVHGDLTCPKCACIASNSILHKPIRLDDGSPYQRRNVVQVVLGRSEGHECTIWYFTATSSN